MKKTPPPTPAELQEQVLTVTELGRYIGRKVQYERVSVSIKTGIHWNQEAGVLDPDLLIEVEEPMPTVRNIRPVLRRLSSLTEEELHHIGKLLCKSAKIEHTFKLERSSNTVGGCFKADGYCNREYFAIFHDQPEMHIETGWYDEGKYDSRNRKWRALTPVAVIDYLDSLSVDIRGYLESGKAVEEG